VKDNALSGRRFDSLAEQNEFLREWNRTARDCASMGRRDSQRFADRVPVSDL
jgi:hypothetical protein